MDRSFKVLKSILKGDVSTDRMNRWGYSTDASPYCMVPMGVVFPKDMDDIRLLIEWANDYSIGITPRGGGTSIAGQAIGQGVVVDVSRYMNHILEVDIEKSLVRVQPGVILSDLNAHLKPFGFRFAPKPSSSDRCTIGGMVGNNASGIRALKDGSVRDYLVAAQVLLSDGSFALFEDKTHEEIQELSRQDSLLGSVYAYCWELLSKESIPEILKAGFPDARLIKRNTGYALDLLLAREPFNLCTILAGSEGTLGFMTELTLKIVPLLPPKELCLCVGFDSVEAALDGNIAFLELSPYAIELMDKTVLDKAEEHPTFGRYMKMIHGGPQAVLIIEIRGEYAQEMEEQVISFRAIAQGLNVNEERFQVYRGAQVQQIWDIRKAGIEKLEVPNELGAAVAVIEDAAICPEFLPDYMKELRNLLNSYQLQYAVYGSVGTGSLCVRPVLDLSLQKDKALFRNVSYAFAALVKKHNGSLSGAHGDGMLRGEYVPLMFGSECYVILKRFKKIFDLHRRFNPGKIIHAGACNAHLRAIKQPRNKTLRLLWEEATRCNSASDCKESIRESGQMCPMFKASQEERYSPRGLMAQLRIILKRSAYPTAFRYGDFTKSLNACLACKACASECPSQVRIDWVKYLYLSEYYKQNPWLMFRPMWFAHMPSIYGWMSEFPKLFNSVVQQPLLSKVIKWILGVAPAREIPLVHSETFISWANKQETAKSSESKPQVYFFVDEFSNYVDVEIAQYAYQLLNKLGYEVSIARTLESGRTALAEGFLSKAKKVALFNVNRLFSQLGKDDVLVGIEPSALLCLREEYLRLVPKTALLKANYIAKRSCLIDEFLMKEWRAGRINLADFHTLEYEKVFLHPHCHVVAARIENYWKELLSEIGYKVQMSPDSCCGMSGTYGYKKKTYHLSKRIAEQKLIPAIEKMSDDVWILAPGTSCRTQIKDFSHRKVLHPVELLYKSML